MTLYPKLSNGRNSYLFVALGTTIVFGRTQYIHVLFPYNFLGALQSRKGNTNYSQLFDGTALHFLAWICFRM